MTPDELIQSWAEQVRHYRFMNGVIIHGVTISFDPQQDPGNRTAPFYTAMDGREHEAGEFVIVKDWRVEK